MKLHVRMFATSLHYSGSFKKKEFQDFSPPLFPFHIPVKAMKKKFNLSITFLNSISPLKFKYIITRLVLFSLL